MALERWRLGHPLDRSDSFTRAQLQANLAGPLAHLVVRQHQALAIDDNTAALFAVVGFDAHHGWHHLFDQSHQTSFAGGVGWFVSRF